jgi:hypothetical protein
LRRFPQRGGHREMGRWCCRAPAALGVTSRSFQLA